MKKIGLVALFALLLAGFVMMAARRKRKKICVRAEAALEKEKL